MPQMSSTYATIHATHDLIYALQNPEPSSPLVKLVNIPKGKLITLEKIFRKATPKHYF